MKNKQKGFLEIIALIIVALASLGAGVYVYTSLKTPSKVTYEESLQHAVEQASSTDKATTVVIGVSSKTNSPITAEVSTQTDSKGDKIPSIVVNKDELNKAVAEKYKNTPQVNKLIRARLQASFGTFAIAAITQESKEGTYRNVCLTAKAKIEADIQTSLDQDDGLSAALGISMSSYNLDKIVCKAVDGAFIIALPITLEDGTAAKVCSTATQMGTVGDANFTTYTCIKK
jgi:hypothetical protein